MRLRHLVGSGGHEHVLQDGADLQRDVERRPSTCAHEDRIRGAWLESRRDGLDPIAPLREAVERELAAGIARDVAHALAVAHERDLGAADRLAELIEDPAVQRRACGGHLRSKTGNQGE